MKFSTFLLKYFSWNGSVLRCVIFFTISKLFKNCEVNIFFPVIFCTEKYGWNSEQDNNIGREESASYKMAKFESVSATTPVGKRSRSRFQMTNRFWKICRISKDSLEGRRTLKVYENERSMVQVKRYPS